MSSEYSMVYEIRQPPHSSFTCPDDGKTVVMPINAYCVVNIDTNMSHMRLKHGKSSSCQFVRTKSWAVYLIPWRMTHLGLHKYRMLCRKGICVARELNFSTEPPCLHC